MKKFLVLFVAALFFQSLSALEADFTQGRVKNFWVAVFKKSAYTVGKGLTFEGKGRIHAAKLQLDTAKIPTVEMKTDGNVKLVKLYYAAANQAFSENQMVRGRVAGDRVIFELAGRKNWTSIISQLRFDLYPVSDRAVVKSISFPELVPGVPPAVDFTTGSMNRWRIIMAKKGTKAVTGKGVDITATGKERLLSPALKIDAGKCDLVEVAMTGEYTTVKLYFTSGKEPLT